MSKLFKSSDIFLIPNLITILRLVLIVPLVMSYYFDCMIYLYVLLGVVILTDFLDGFLARRLNQISDLGKLLDPIADGLILFTFSVVLYFESRIDLWFCVFYFCRQFLLLILSMTLLPKADSVYGSNIVGKWGVGFLTLGLGIYVIKIESLFSFVPLLIYIATALLFLSLLDYLRVFYILSTKK
ncbi:MAG: CDP-alcohol phosphatidyltransferase family protein [Candidatus Neomarinimicrobiota bacterium]